MRDYFREIVIYRCKYHTLLSLLFIGICLITNSACSEYRTFTLQEGIGHFSFEYSSSYKVAKVEVRDDLGYTDVNLIGGTSDDWKTNISVFVYVPGDLLPDATSTVDDVVSSPPGRWRDFKLIDRSPIKVSGLLGEQIIISCELPYHTPDAEVELIPCAMKYIYLDYNGLIWKISLNSHRNASEAANADFNYILTTFQLLN